MHLRAAEAEPFPSQADVRQAERIQENLMTGNEHR